jgi:phage tail sheath protein FI
MMIDEICEAAVPFLRYFVHEPNTDFNRRQIESNLARLCQYYVDRGGLKDYLVTCDGRVNSVVDEASGKLNVFMYLVPTLPTERIDLVCVISPQGVDLKTLVGNQ